MEEDEPAEETDDAGLGYYEDGTIRTLTDEQIAMFRHSEIQTLLRERRHAREAKECDDDNQRERGGNGLQSFHSVIFPIIGMAVPRNILSRPVEPTSS